MSTKLNGKLVTLDQLDAEMKAAGLPIRGLGLSGDQLFTYDTRGQPADLPSGADAVIAAHAAQRPVTDAEYQAQFAAAANDPMRQQTIRDILLGLVRRERVSVATARTGTATGPGPTAP